MSRISLAHAQRGVASVEAILLLPFILLFLVWILVSLRLALVKEHNIIEARTSAWRHSMFNQACQGARTPRYSGWYKGATCATNSVDGETFINALSGGRYEIQFAGVIRGAGVPALSTATARSVPEIPERSRSMEPVFSL